MQTKTLIAVLSTLLMTSCSFAAQIFLSTSTTFGTGAAADAASLVNPTINLNTTATIAIWVKVPKPTLQRADLEFATDSNVARTTQVANAGRFRTATGHEALKRQRG